MLPKNNELPATTYEAKQVVCPLGLEIQKIHACPNDCILYRGEEYEKLDACPVCHALRYKIRRDDPGDVDGEHPTKKIPAKIMWLCSYNTTLETSVQKQRPCKVVVMAQRRP